MDKTFETRDENYREKELKDTVKGFHSRTCALSFKRIHFTVTTPPLSNINYKNNNILDIWFVS